MTEQSALEKIQERIAWWRNDVSYKAPEQIDLQYVFTLLNKLNGDIKAALAAAPATTERVQSSNPPCAHCDEIIQTGDKFEIVGTGMVAHVACHDVVLAEFQPAEKGASDG